MRFGLLYQPKIDAAVRHAMRVADTLSKLGHEAWTSSSWEIESAHERIAQADLLITFGGDGTLVRAARAAAPSGAACVGVNYGRLGFLTELNPVDVEDALPRYLDGLYWVEERVVLEWRHLRGDQELAKGLAANDVVVGRGRIARVIEVDVRINDALLTTYTADGVIVATATGSTGYNQAAHGPVLHPEVKEIVVTPISPFLTPSNAVVTPAHASVELIVRTRHEATLSIDGQSDLMLETDDHVLCRGSGHPARFARLQPRDYFYTTLAEKLRWRVPRHMTRPEPAER